MGSVVSALTGGGKGAGFTAQSADVVTPTTAQNATDQYTNAQNALTQQQQFLQAVQGQNGIQNQSNVFNQLQGVANGTGPNPAQAQLAQATGANTANQAALMAGQRGAGANAGLIARQAAMQGGANQQNAAGQAATLQAQQSLNALGQMGNISGQQVANQAAATGANTQAAQGEQGLILNSINAQNQANISNTQQQNAANAQIAAANQQSQGAILGGLLQGGAGLAGSLLTGGASTLANTGLASTLGGNAGAMVARMQKDAEGGMVEKYADGGDVAQPQMQPSGPSSSFGKFLSTIGKAVAPQPAPSAIADGLSELAKSFTATQKPQMAEGGKVPALVSPGEKYLSPELAKKVAEGRANPMKDGKTVPGTPKVGGAKNSYANDTVPATLEEGGIVIPRSVTKSKNPEAEAVKFVRAIYAKKGSKAALSKG